MDEYLVLSVLAKVGESEADFKTRLAHFWTHMLRHYPADYEKVYAEATHFDRHADHRLIRRYMIEATAIDTIERQLSQQGLEFVPADRNDLFSKYEATPPDWFWIEH